DLARGSGLRPYYEYWAYPPGMLLVWWPIARAWFLLGGPIAERFASPDAFTAVPIPVLLSLGLKLPTIAGDVAITALLARLASASVARWYWLNPYVLLVGLWTFDAVMVALALGGLAAALRQRWLLAGVLLGAGAAVKFVPALLVLGVLSWALRPSPRPLSALVSAGRPAHVAVSVLLLPS